ncbi:MAG: sugar phosphate isomerase/epimerase [Fimbriimonadaceae bacterium]|nr:sugar phosphate isomerase/epimerase [Fimbriimonadaceae bacterium]
MRLGTTSYIIPADIVPNVEFLAPRVDDVELVLFELDEQSNLPDVTVRQRLAELAAAHDLTYTVHLPLDLKLAADGSAADVSIDLARRVIDAVRDLSPYAYVLHLNGEDLLGGPSATGAAAWRRRACRSLEVVGAHVGDLELLAVENLETWDPAHFAALFEELPISRCADIGHLWKMGRDPLEVLPAWLPRTRVVHLHGLAERDHQSLAWQDPEQLDPVVAALCAGYAGVITLEVFGENDFDSSLAAWHAARARVQP